MESSSSTGEWVTWCCWLRVCVHSSVVSCDFVKQAAVKNVLELKNQSQSNSVAAVGIEKLVTVRVLWPLCSLAPN